MEFINPDKQYEKETKMYCSATDVAALDNMFTTTETQTMPHTMDNGFLDSSFGKTCLNARQKDIQIIGVCHNAPWYRNDCYAAVIIENTKDFSKSWCHINETILNWWKGQASV